MITVDEKGKNIVFFLHTAGLIEVKTVVNFFLPIAFITAFWLISIATLHKKYLTHNSQYWI